MRLRSGILLGLAAVALRAEGAPRGSFSEAFTVGSGPYIGNSMSAGISPGPVDLDLGWDFGSDRDLAIFHSFWASLGLWPSDSLKLSVDGDLGPRVSSDSARRGHYALSGGGGGLSIAVHPRGDVRPYLQFGGGLEHLDIEGSTNPGGGGSASAAFDQISLGGTVGVDVDRTSVRAGASKFFYSHDAGALQLPPGVGSGPLGLGAQQGPFPTRPEDFSLRASLRQRFGDREAWDAQVRLTFAPYVDGVGSVGALGLRLGKELSRRVHGFLGVTGQLEQLGGTSFGLFGSAGVSVGF